MNCDTFFVVVDKRFVRRTSSLFVVAYSFAAWKYPQNVPSLIDFVWFDAMKGQYEARYVFE